MLAKAELYDLLDRRGIPCEVVEHPAVYTMEDAVRSVLALRGKGGGTSC